jgi:nucleotide-binding universal stress UspA family protein
MYRTVLWATDGSAVADGALVEALKLLDADGQLIAFHCDERFSGVRLGGGTVFADELDRLAKIRAQVDQLKAAGTEVRLIVEKTHQNAAGEIAAAAEDNQADVIVCGTRGFGVVAGAVAGSVAMRLPHLATRPVVVISEAAAASAAELVR